MTEGIVPRINFLTELESDINFPPGVPTFWTGVESRIMILEVSTYTSSLESMVAGAIDVSKEA